MEEDFISWIKLEWGIKESSSRNITVTLQKGVLQVQGRMHQLSTIRVMDLEEMDMSSRITEDSEWSTMLEIRATTSSGPRLGVTRRAPSSISPIQELSKQTLPLTWIGSQPMETSWTKSTSRFKKMWRGDSPQEVQAESIPSSILSVKVKLVKSERSRSQASKAIIKLIRDYCLSRNQKLQLSRDMGQSPWELMMLRRDSHQQFKM
mgnify:CR=1 FL=1